MISFGSELSDLRERLEYDERVLGSIERVYGEELVIVLRSLLTPPQRLYLRVNTLRISREDVIRILREEGAEAYPDPYIEEAVYLKVHGPNKIRDSGLRVFVDKRAAESIMMGANLYSPGVIRCDPGIKRGSIVSIYSENMILLAEGEAQISCEEALDQRRGLFVKTLKSLYKAPSVRDLSVWRHGYVYPQSLPSMIASRLLEPRENEIIIDMCAAPGGKTSHIFELSGGRARVVAFDHSRKRVEEMIANLERLGYREGIEIRVGDSRYISVDYPGLVADKIMLDPPCTATGVRPKIYDKKNEKELLSLVRYQEQFLREAHKILRKNGLLVYSTCSITYDENEALINKILGEKLFEPIEPPDYIKRISYTGTDGVGIRFHPHKNDSPGHYMILLKKI